MKLKDIYTKNKGERGANPVISFEVFPPKNGDNTCLIEELNVLKKFKPSLISVTYGAGGSNNQNLDLVKLVKQDLQLNPMPHFTCACKDKSFIENYIEQIKSQKIENILALRGDIKDKENSPQGAFCYANQLVEFIRKKSDLSIGVAGYPEGHTECPTLKKDIENLKRKVDAGADVIFTQLFFENDYFYSYCDNLISAGVNKPVVAGILPISSYTQVEKMITLCGSKIPQSLQEKLDKYKDSPEDIKKIGIEFAVKQCRDLIQKGVIGLHFYCLNKSQPVKTILENIL